MSSGHYSSTPNHILSTVLNVALEASTTMLKINMRSRCQTSSNRRLSWVDSQGGPSLSDLCDRIKNGEKTILVAEYGVGKSMLLRQLFHELVREFRSKTHFRTPIAINLRDHLGQSDPVELLERHARSNAADPQNLVAAWNAGYVDLLIDGFDELSTRGLDGRHQETSGVPAEFALRG